MKLIALQQISGGSPVSVDEEIEVDDTTAIRYINKGIAKAKTQKAHNDLVARVEKQRAEDEEKEAKVLAIQKDDELRTEASRLLDEAIAIAKVIESNDPKYRDVFLRQVHEAFTATVADKKAEEAKKAEPKK